MFWSAAATPKEQPPQPEKALFEAVSAMISEALIVYDKDFKILVFNQQAEELFSIKAGDVLGQNFTLDKAQDPKWQPLSPIIYSLLAPQVARLSPVGADPQVIKVILDDPHREYEVLTSEIKDVQGQSWGFVKVVRDLTREAGLLKTKSEFITIAAHQLRTPATSVNWALEGLAKEPALTENAKGLIDTGVKASQVLLKIINDLLNVAQIEEGRFGYQFQEIDLVEFLDKLLADFLPIAKEAKINLFFDRPPEKVSVAADPARLAMAVSNLIDNALKYNVVNGEVIVKLEAKDGQALVSIKDTGVGITKDNLEKLFTKFFRGENVQRAASTGSGLGLFITKNIIEAHKGKVWAESVPNRGSTFYFSIPLKNAGAS